MKNDDQWLKQVAEKMNGFEVDEPAGLWDEIARSQPAARPAKRPVSPARRLLAVAASIAVAILLSCIFLFIGHDELPEVPIADNINTPRVQPTIPESIARQPIVNHTTPQPIARDTKQDFKFPVASAAVMPTPCHKELPKPQLLAINMPVASSDVVTASNDDFFVQLPRRRASSVTIGAFTSGSTGNSTSGGLSAARYSTINQLIYDSEYAETNPMVRSRATNSIDTKAFDMQHRQPLRFGLSVSYRLGRDIAIESGISYSHLASDISYSGSSEHLTGEQRLNYIGIPVNLIYNIAHWKSFRAYVSSGVLGEKLVAGRLSGQSTDANDRMQQRDFDLTEKRLQWSVNASAGLQYDITTAVGLYVEPGVSYHFDNRSEIRNIYKDRPCNFNLNIGLRLSLPR